MKQNINEPFKGLHTDNSQQEQPKESYRYALNAVNETSEGNQTTISNEGSNYACTSIPEGFRILGDRYLENNISVLLLTNVDDTRQIIGTLNKNNQFETIVDTKVLGFKLQHQIDITYRLRRGNERIIYWVDGYNNPRSFNLDRVHNHYTQAYKNYLNTGGDPSSYTLEKWDVNSFDLIKTYTKIPWFSDVEVLNYGSVRPGSYNFAVQYIDEDLNPTEWINVSNTVNIYNSSLEESYENIRGSYTVNEYQKFGEANKSIKLTLSNLDESYPYYRIAIIQATEGTGQVTKTLVSPQQSTNIGTYIYSGNDSAFVEIDVNEIRIESESILQPSHIEQLENRLLLANTRGQQYNWCEFQKYASEIDTNLVTEEVILNNIDSRPNLKNSKSSFFLRGYMPGEVYSFGVVYIMKDNSLSPVFHIPGKSMDNVTSTMGVYESSYFYPNIHDCVGTDYWGRDVVGNPLLGQKVRHHKFPTRQEANIPLVEHNESVISYWRYILKMKVTLKPGKEYPLDVLGNPILIGYQADYKITGLPTSSYSSFINESSLGLTINILDTTSTSPTYLEEVSPGNYVELNVSSQILVDYSDIFDIELSHEIIEDDTITDAAQSKIFGIEFMNIGKPHPDVIGFYIVRNEVFDDDKLIVDNAIIGPNIVENDYTAFSHITPAFPTSKFDKKSVWFFSPEVNFNQKLLSYNDIDVQGCYETSTVIRPKDLYSAGADPIIGVYIEDVQAGTSYNAEAHGKREEDSDGFSLQCGYKTTTFKYYTDIYPVGKLKNSFVLTATANKIISGTNYYNTSTDNRIAMAEFSDTFDTSAFKTNTSHNISYSVIGGGHTCIVKGSRLMYASLRRGYYEGSVWKDMSTAYQDFMTRAYYKEHMHPMYFEDNVVIDNFKVFNGDVYISSLDFLTSMFRRLYLQKRSNKKSLWKYIVGAVLVVVGAVLLALAPPLGATAIAGAMALLSAGAYFVHSGVQMDKLVAMIDEDYEKGLLKCIDDDVVINYLGSPDSLGTGDPNYLDLGDDTIQWFADRASNLYIESRVPVGLRSGATVLGVTDFLNSPSKYNDSIMYNYLVEKLTYFDREQGGGRLYRGVANAEVYSVNPDYSRYNREKSYIHLPSTYDCCQGEALEQYPNRIWYSQQSFQEELTDNYRTFLPNNYRDVEGENGGITDLYKIGGSLFIHTNEALWQLPQNVQERSTNELTTYIGTGDFFSLPPRKVLDDNLGSGGSKHKWATIKTKMGVLFVSEVENKIYLHGEGIKDISTLGMRNWFENNLKSYLSTEVNRLSGKDYPYDNNPANPLGVGYLACYDTRHERFIITKKDWKILKELEVINRANIDITPVLTPPLYTEVVYNTYYGEFWRVNHHPGGITSVKGRINRFEDYPEIFENKSFTISYSLHTNSWVSFHSYIPNYYIHNQDNFYSFVVESNNIWKHNMKDNFQTYYDKFYPHILEYVSNSSPIETRIWEDLTLMTEAQKWDEDSQNFVEDRWVTFNKITLSNTRQCSGELDMIVKSEQEDYLFNQVTNNPGEILIDRQERDWNINQLRDYVIDYTKPFYNKDWTSIKLEYPIDKVVNYSVIDFDKDWTQVESFRDKFLNIRLKFNNFANIKLITQFTVETENLS